FVGLILRIICDRRLLGCYRCFPGGGHRSPDAGRASARPLHSWRRRRPDRPPATSGARPKVTMGRSSAGVVERRRADNAHYGAHGKGEGSGKLRLSLLGGMLMTDGYRQAGLEKPQWAATIPPGRFAPPSNSRGGRSRPRVCAYKHIHVPPPAEHEL